MRRALEMNRRLYPPSEFPLGHANLDTSRNNLAVALFYSSKLEEAEQLYREASPWPGSSFPADTFPSGHEKIAVSLNNLGMLLLLQRKPDEAEKLISQHSR